MRILRAFLVYLGVVFLGAALVAPWIYLGVQEAALTFPKQFSGLASQPFHRYVNRCLQGLAVIGIWPFLRALSIQSWKSIGLAPITGQARCLAWGYVLGFGTLAGVATAAGLAGARVVQQDLSLYRMLSVCGGALGSAVVVAFIEEVVFRGVIFGRLRLAVGKTTALLFSSIFYALVHFFQRPPPPSEVTPWTGLRTLAQMLHGFVDWHDWMPAFLTLCVAGWILATLYAQTGTLYASIGLHGGWIFWLKTYGSLTVARPEASAWIWGSSRLLDGWVAFGAIVLCSLWVDQRQVRRP